VRVESSLVPERSRAGGLLSASGRAQTSLMTTTEVFFERELQSELGILLSNTSYYTELCFSSPSPQSNYVACRSRIPRARYKILRRLAHVGGVTRPPTFTPHRESA
jgi:hypothetical protein